MHWQELSPRKPWYYFIPVNYELIEKYEEFWQVNKIFEEYTIGIQSSRDNIAFDFTISGLKKKIAEFRDLNITDNYIKEKYKLKDTREWSMREAREYMNLLKEWEIYIDIASYRPFDNRAIYYHPKLLHRTRQQIMQHMLAGDNVGLVFSRNEQGAKIFDHIFVTQYICDLHTLPTNNYISPLYLYTQNNRSQNDN